MESDWDQEMDDLDAAIAQQQLEERRRWHEDFTEGEDRIRKQVSTNLNFLNTPRRDKTCQK